MGNFTIWLLLDESGRLDIQGFNDLFRQQLEELLTRVHDPRRRAALESMKGTNWMGYLLTALRNAGITHKDEREAYAAQVAEYLLVSPGKLFQGYDPDGSGPMPARWVLAVQNAVRNVVRDRRRQNRRSAIIDADAVMARPEPDDEVLEMFRTYLRQELGELAVELVDRRLDGQSLSQIVATPSFEAMGIAGVRRMFNQVRQAAGRYARGTRDVEFRREVVGRLGEVVMAGGR